MKPLDEVITAVHHCGLLTGFDDTYEYDGGCPYEDCSKCEQKRMLGKDIIYYLKEFQGLSKMWNDKLDKEQKNEPLTWDELKGMEDKPVWVEYISCKRKVWAIVDCFYTDAFGKVNMNVALPHDYWHLEKELIGKAWQAYRKGRE